MRVVEGAHCAVHASLPADRTCARCGAFACSSCETNPFHPGMCPGCVQRLTGAASTRAIVAVGFAAVAVSFLCLPLGIVAAILGHAEVGAIDRGESSEAGRSYAVAAKWVGIVTGGLSLVVTAILVVIGLVAWLARSG